jgi:hypothetical protein
MIITYCLLGCNALWFGRYLANVSEEPAVFIFRAEESSETLVPTRTASHPVIFIVTAVRTSHLPTITAFLPVLNSNLKPHRLHFAGGGFVVVN